MIYIETTPLLPHSATNTVDQFFFDSENGDDWNYVDVGIPYEQRAKDDLPPFKMSTVSGTETTLISFKYNRTPEHKVLHQGRCNSAGLKPAADGTNTEDEDLALARLTVQEIQFMRQSQPNSTDLVHQTGFSASLPDLWLKWPYGSRMVEKYLPLNGEEVGGDISQSGQCLSIYCRISVSI